MAKSVKTKNCPGENFADILAADRAPRVLSFRDLGEQESTRGTDGDHWSFTLWAGEWR